MHLQAEAGLFVMLDLREFLEDSSKVGSVILSAFPLFVVAHVVFVYLF